MSRKRIFNSVDAAAFDADGNLLEEHCRKLRREGVVDVDSNGFYDDDLTAQMPPHLRSTAILRALRDHARSIQNELRVKVIANTVAACVETATDKRKPLTPCRIGMSIRSLAKQRSWKFNLPTAAAVKKHLLVADDFKHLRSTVQEATKPQRRPHAKEIDGSEDNSIDRIFNDTVREAQQNTPKRPSFGNSEKSDSSTAAQVGSAVKAIPRHRPGGKGAEDNRAAGDLNDLRTRPLIGANLQDGGHELGNHGSATVHSASAAAEDHGVVTKEVCTGETVNDAASGHGARDARTRGLSPSADEGGMQAGNLQQLAGEVESLYAQLSPGEIGVFIDSVQSALSHHLAERTARMLAELPAACRQKFVDNLRKMI